MKEVKLVVDYNKHNIRVNWLSIFSSFSAFEKQESV